MKPDENFESPAKSPILLYLFSILAFVLFIILLIFTFSVAKKMPEDNILLIWIISNFLMLIIGIVLLTIGKKNIKKPQLKWYSIISIILGVIIVIFQAAVFAILTWLFYGYRHGL